MDNSNDREWMSTPLGGRVLPVEILGNAIGLTTKATGEANGIAKFTVMGRPKQEEYVPIDEACAVCDHWKKPKLGSVDRCREVQKRGAELRSFKTVICPNQFKSEYDKLLRGEK